ncbi:LPXTG cell wall anchor domain-containing protein, partial [Gleimia sp. 6138-11-ORH1]|uniref:LPXTG cell wall anchor domain-containing protein n=1 Tax=Gleimia sp. 6138-11-ORH1 TaxID=2973937 RepID=UPI002169014C
ENAYAPALYDTALKLAVGKSDRFIKIGDPKKITLVDKATLDCDPRIATAPVVEAKFDLVPAQCVNKVAEDNQLKVTGKVAANVRFVATVDGQSISLKQELREKLSAAGTLTLADLQAAYPNYAVPYGKELQVQMYYFDAENAYAPALYDTALKLAVGKSDRFIKIGDPKKITLVDKATLDCKVTDPVAPEQPKVTDPVAPEQPKVKEPNKEQPGKSAIAVKPGKKATLPQTGSSAGLLAIFSILTLFAGITLMRTQRKES